MESPDTLPAFFVRGAKQAGIAAEAGVAVKDQLHAAAVEDCSSFNPSPSSRLVCGLRDPWSRYARSRREPPPTPGPHQPHSAVVCSPLEI